MFDPTLKLSLHRWENEGGLLYPVQSFTKITERNICDQLRNKNNRNATPLVKHPPKTPAIRSNRPLRDMA